MNRMNLNALKIFVTVVEHGSFVGASRTLNLPSSNISRAVTQLEQQLQCQLLIRSTRQLRLTEFGEILFASAKPLIDGMHNAQSQLAAMQNTLVGQLSITIPNEAGPLLLGKLLIEFALKHPDLQIKIQTNFLGLENLHNNADLALFFHRGEVSDSTMIIRKVCSFESIIVASPDLLQSIKIPKNIQQLLQVPCITTSTILNQKPWLFCNAKGGYDVVNVSGRFCADSGMLAKEAALKGLGFAILAKQACQHELDHQQLIAIELDQQPAALDLLLAYPSRKYASASVRVFIEALMNHCKYGVNPQFHQ